MIYVEILKNALQDLEPGDVAARRNLYQGLIAGLKTSLEERHPPVDWREKLLELRLLRSTVQRIEGDLRAGIDVTAEEYVPEGLEEEQARLDALKAITEKAKGPAAPPEDLTALVDTLKSQMQALSLAPECKGFRERVLRPTTLGTVMSRLLNDIVAARGILGLVWILTEPLLLIGTAVCGYLMLNERSVMNMDVIPFTICGVVAWLLFRVTLIRVSTSPQMAKEALALPPIGVTTILLGQAAIQYCIYSVSVAVLLIFAAQLGHGEFPENWVLFAFYWTLMWIFGISAGIVMSPFLAEWHSGARAFLICIRFLGWTSGLVYVSEQFPSDLKYYILWNPLCHGMQLLRSAYFPQYESEDASLFYFLTSISVTIMLAAVSGRMLAPRVEPA